MSATCACEAQLQPHEPIKGVCFPDMSALDDLRGAGQDLDIFMITTWREDLENVDLGGEG